MVEIICPHCYYSREIPEERIPEGVRWARCPRCQERFEVLPNTVRRASAPSERGDLDSSNSVARVKRRYQCPWEARSRLGLWRGIYQTLKAVLFSPEDLFRNGKFEAGIREPLAYGLLLGSMGAMISLFWQFLMLAGGIAALDEPAVGRMAMSVVFLIVLVFVPLFVLVSMFMYSGVLHLFLLLVRGGPRGFEATFRVVAYSQATQVWALIPFLGGWVAGIWQLVVQIIGLREIHETSYGRVIVAFLIPVAILLAVVVVGVILLFLYSGEPGFGRS